MFEGVTEIFMDDIQPAYGIFPNVITPLDARGSRSSFLAARDQPARLDITWFAADWGEGEMPADTRTSGTPA